jgi:hypothetical protein
VPAYCATKYIGVVEQFHAKSLFSEKPGLVTTVQHEVPTGDSQPYRANARPMTKEKRKILDKIINNLLDDEIIEPCESILQSCPVLVPKNKPNCAPKWRLCIDYRVMNSRSTAKSHSMPRIDILSQLGQANVFTTIDLSQGYHQIDMKPEDRDKTAFVTPHRGTFGYKRMPFGLKGAGFTFQSLIDKTLSYLLYNCCMAFLDDVIIYSRIWEEHATHLQQVFERLTAAGFTVNSKKIHIGKQRVKLLGHNVETGKVSPDSDKVKAIQEYPTHKTVKALQRFLGAIGFYRAYILCFSLLAGALTKLLRKAEEWVWGEKQEKAFQDLKCALLADTCLDLPNMDEEFVISCDASTDGLGAVLAQQGDKGLRPIAFASRLLRAPEHNYCITELDCLAVVFAIQKFLPYIEHTHFTLETDHIALKYMLSMEEPSGRVRRWAMRLMGLDCTVVYKRGPTNLVADALSRAPCAVNTEKESDSELMIDDRLPVEDDGSGECRLTFDPTPEYTAEHHTCQKCVRPPKKESIRMPQGPRLPVMNSYHTSIRDPRDLPITGNEWSDAQEEDPELSVIMNLVANDDPRIIECVFLVDDDGVLRKLEKKVT